MAKQYKLKPFTAAPLPSQPERKEKKFRRNWKRFERGLEPLAAVSQEVKIGWNLRSISGLTKVPKKWLRKALAIIQTAELEAEVKEKGKMVKKTFHFGFHEFTLRRKNKDRKILAPHPDVQKVYEGIKEWLNRNFTSHPNAHGFVSGRDYKSAVEALVGQKHFFGFDISEAFPSILKEMAKDALQKHGISEILADSLSWLATCNYDGQRRLPQGASCSPAFLNLVYKTMCEEIGAVCQQNGISWTVYSDDFNFGAESISPEIKKQLLQLPRKYGFAIKTEKVKDNFGRIIPHLLGLTIVDGQIHISRRRKKLYRRMLYAHRKFGDYSDSKISGNKGAISFVYGEEKKWPGWLKVKAAAKKRR